MSRHAIYGALILMVCAISAVAGISANYTGSATLPAPQNVTLSGTTEGIDVRWNIAPGSDEVVNYQIAYQAMQRPRADSWAFMWTQGKTSTHLIRHLAGGYEYRAYVRSCSETQCNSEWAYGGTVWTEKPRSVAYNPVPTATPIPTPTPTATPTPTPNPYPNGIDPWLQLSWHEARHTDEGYLRPIMYYVVMRWTGSNTGRLLQVAWREASSGGEWNIINREDVSYDGIQNLKPATDYEVKARRRLLEFDDDFRPWSKTYTVRTSDVPAPQPCTPTTGVLYPDPYYLPGGPIVFVNPDQQEWTYTYRVSAPASSYGRVSINQDGQWTFETKYGFNDPIITTGQIENFDGTVGARNRFVFNSDFVLYVNDDRILLYESGEHRFLAETNGSTVRTSKAVEYEYYRVTYSECRQWWHYW